MNATSLKRDCTLAVFAHELREPLSSILLAAQVLAETGSDGGVHHELCGLIARQGRYLARMIDGALETRHPDGEGVRLHKEWFDLTRVVEEAVETVRPILRERRHRLDVSLPVPPPYLCADPLRVQQVIVNLLNNAAKYTEPGGAIHLAVEGNNAHLCLTVSDNGIGMSRALLARIFDFFEQGVRTSPARYTGSGIGLAVVRSLVELHGGSVHAHSDGPGMGAAFTVRLPVHPPESLRHHAFATPLTPRDHLAALSPMLDA